MTSPIIQPPVLKEDIESTFDVEWCDGTLCIEAAHTWRVSKDPCDWSNLTREQWRSVELTQMEIEIRREFDYRPRPDSKYNAHVACYINKYCDVPDVHGFNSNSKYSHDFPDPWLFEEDQEEFRVKNGTPVERCLNSYYDDDDELQTDEWYEPLYEDELGQVDITTFAYAHHMGKLEESPGPVDQIKDVLGWNYPESITLEEYKRSDKPEPVVAD